MCEPTTIAAMMVVSQGVQFVAQRQQTRRQEAYNREAVELEKKRAIAEAQSIRLQQSQQDQAVSREIQDVQRRSREAQATAQVAAGEAGVSGLSVDQTLAEYDVSLGRFLEQTQYQQKLNALSADLQLRDTFAASTMEQHRLDSPVNQPSILEGVTSMATAGIQGYSTGLQIKNART